MSDPTPVTQRRSIWARLYHGETAVRIVPRKRLWASISGAVIVAGLISLATQGLNLGIDFEGGTVWTVPAEGVSVSEVRDALADAELEGAEIQQVGGDAIRVQAEPRGATAGEQAEAREQVAQVLAELADTDIDDVSIEEVGPTWGESITRKALRALVAFLVIVSIYIALRFEWKMALATLAALLHDILVTVGVYSITRFEVTPATVIAFLTILGYSIYDGIVVFDKVEENARGLAATGRMTYSDMVDLSLNQTLMRSLNTSITALLPIASLLVVGAGILGAVTLREFGLALLIGLAASAYSSIFIASPFLATLKEREPRYATLRQRLEARGGGGAPMTPAAAGAAAAGRSPAAATPAPSGEGGPPLVPGVGRVGGQGVQPRARKKGKRR